MKKLILLFGILNLVLISAKSQTAASIYQQFKDNQFKFPKHPQYDTIFVGTFNTQNQEFTGLKSIQIKVGRRWELRSPQVESIGRRTVLRYHVDNYSGSFTVKVNGISTQNQAGQNDIYIDVYDNKDIRWEIIAGNSNTNNSFKITKIPLIAAGVFKIPYLVVAIVYQPPKDLNGNNYTEYSKTEFVGSSISLGFGTDRSEKKPISTDLGTFKSLLANGSQLLSQSSNAYAQAAGGTLSALNQGLGSYTATETKGRSVNNELTLTLADISSVNIKSVLPNNGGPGIGDRIYCLKNCKFLWYIEENSFYTTLLSTDGDFSPNMTLLKQKIQQGTEMEKNLLLPIASLNPFFLTGSNTALPRRRFVDPKIHECVGGGSTYTDSHIVTQTDKNTTASYSTLVEDYVSGWLSFLGVGVDETKTVQTTVTNSFSKSIITGTTVTATVFLDQSNTCKDYWSYYDNLFGTYAITDQPPLYAEPTHTGIFRDINGNPLPGKTIKIEYKGKVYETTTNEKGEYKFYSPALKTYKSSKIPVLQKSN